MRMSKNGHHQKVLNIFWVVLLLGLLGAAPAGAATETLLVAFSNASPGSGYDTLVVLDSGTIYTGGLDLPAGNHCIVGNGATVNLQNQSVSAADGVTLDVSGVSFMNGTYGLDFTTGAFGYIECCNFISNNDGMRVWEGASVTVVSCNFVNNGHYGLYRHEYGLVHNEYNNAWGNTNNDYVYYCPG